MSKRGTRTILKRSMRRALNSTWEPLKMTGRKMLRTSWGSGLKRTDITKNHIKEEEML